MNGVAGFIGWLVIWCAVAVVVCVPVGKFIAYRTRADRPRSSRDEFSPLRPVPFGGRVDASPSEDSSRYVQPKWQPSDDDLRDTGGV